MDGTATDEATVQAMDLSSPSMFRASLALMPMTASPVERLVRAQSLLAVSARPTGARL